MINELKLSEKDIDVEQITIRMPRFIMEFVKERAKLQGMATIRWIKSLVQSNLIQPTVLNDSAIIAVRESNRELASIGNNFNQIARRLNESVFKTDMVKVEMIEEVKRDIKNIRFSIKELIKVSRDGWSLDNDDS